MKGPQHQLAAAYPALPVVNEIGYLPGDPGTAPGLLGAAGQQHGEQHPSRACTANRQKQSPSQRHDRTVTWGATSTGPRGNRSVEPGWTCGWPSQDAPSASGEIRAD